MPVDFLKKKLKSILSDSQKRRIKSMLDSARYQAIRVTRQSKMLTTIYFHLRGTFHMEQHVILSGQIVNYESRNKKSNQEPIHDLIRGVHRIEKGLSMKSRKSIFAENYIEELVKLYKSIYESRGEQVIDDDQFRWATDVLDDYFHIVQRTEIIEKSYQQYQTVRSKVNLRESNKKPFRHSELSKPSVEFSDLKQLAERRHSTRWFEQRPVEHEKIDAALEVALESPSACNRQPFEFRIYDDAEMIEKICELPIGVSGYKKNIPCLAVLVGEHRAYFNERDKHLIYIDTSLAAMTFQYALETQDISTCCINWPAIPSREREMKHLLELADDEEVVMLMAIGYADPDGGVPYSEKRSPQDVRRYNVIGESDER